MPQRDVSLKRKDVFSTRRDVFSNPFTVYPHTLSPIADAPFTYIPRNFHRIPTPLHQYSTNHSPYLRNRSSSIPKTTILVMSHLSSLHKHLFSCSNIAELVAHYSLHPSVRFCTSAMAGAECAGIFAETARNLFMFSEIFSTISVFLEKVKTAYHQLRNIFATKLAEAPVENVQNPRMCATRKKHRFAAATDNQALFVGEIVRHIRGCDLPHDPGIGGRQRISALIGHEKRKAFKAAVYSFLNDYTHHRVWDIEDVQGLGGQIAYYRNVEKENIDAIILSYNQRFGVDMMQIIKDIISNR